MHVLTLSCTHAFCLEQHARLLCEGRIASQAIVRATARSAVDAAARCSGKVRMLLVPQAAASTLPQSLWIPMLAALFSAQNSADKPPTCHGTGYKRRRFMCILF